MKKYFFIVCELVDGRNYFCALRPHPQAGHNVTLIEWDTDINYAYKFKTRKQAENAFKKLHAQKDETWQIIALNISFTNPKLN